MLHINKVSFATSTTMSVPCLHCARGFHQGTVRRHESNCSENPERRTCPPLNDPASSKCIPKPRRSAPLRGRGFDTLSPGEPELSRTALVLPGALGTCNTEDHPMQDGIPSEEFSVIMAAPPFSEAHPATAAPPSDSELRALPVGTIASETCLLLLWCSGPTMVRAMALCKSWGFTYETVAFVWIKTNQRAEPQSNRHGGYTNPGTEFVLVATKGDGSTLIAEHTDQVFAAPRTGDFRKPHEMRDMVDAMTGRDPSLRKIDLFSRNPADTKWSAWGDGAREQPSDPTDREEHASDQQKSKPSGGTSQGVPDTEEDDGVSPCHQLDHPTLPRSTGQPRPSQSFRMKLTAGQKAALGQLSSFELNENQEASFDFQKVLMRHNPGALSHLGLKRDFGVSPRQQLDQRTLALTVGQKLALGEFESWRSPKNVNIQ
jgi:N6-adenosine-specific RNA methylase IME4